LLSKFFYLGILKLGSKMIFEKDLHFLVFTLNMTALLIPFYLSQFSFSDQCLALYAIYLLYILKLVEYFTKNTVINRVSIKINTKVIKFTFSAILNVKNLFIRSILRTFAESTLVLSTSKECAVL